MVHCANESCPYFRRQGVRAEYAYRVFRCRYCDSELREGPFHESPLAPAQPEPYAIPEDKTTEPTPDEISEVIENATQAHALRSDSEED